MKQTTLEWIDKAEGDFATARMFYLARRSPNPDPACFDAQQCAGKIPKSACGRSGTRRSQNPQFIRTANADPSHRANVERLGRRTSSPWSLCMLRVSVVDTPARSEFEVSDTARYSRGRGSDDEMRRYMYVRARLILLVD